MTKEERRGHVFVGVENIPTWPFNPESYEGKVWCKRHRRWEWESK